MSIKEFIRRNLPILLVGLVTIVIFLIIILASQQKSDTPPVLQAINEEELIAAHTYVMGNPRAQVTAVEFMDFKCVACAEYHFALIELAVKYPNDLKVAFRHFPQSKDEESIMASMAAQIAGEQNRFWEYARILFQNQKETFEKNLLIEYTNFSDIKADTFSSSLEEGGFRSIVMQDIRDAERFGLKKAPAFYLNGSRFEVKNVGELKNAIEGEIKKLTGDTESQQGSTSSVTTEPPKTERIGKTYVNEIILEESKSVLEITYTEDGWNPKTATGYVGQRVVWKNNTNREVVLEQLDKKFSEFAQPKTIAPGGTLEHTLYGEKIWRYQEKNTKHWGSIYINRLD